MCRVDVVCANWLEGKHGANEKVTRGTTSSVQGCTDEQLTGQDAWTNQAMTYGR